ncbi:unnamed protein product [Ectocarpus sp. CCAP 1310/34]|nr:unnamed protein product [Ectocarpus sp. CCAP 1310/34]
MEKMKQEVESAAERVAGEAAAKMADLQGKVEEAEVRSLAEDATRDTVGDAGDGAAGGAATFGAGGTPSIFDDREQQQRDRDYVRKDRKPPVYDGNFSLFKSLFELFLAREDLSHTLAKPASPDQRIWLLNRLPRSENVRLHDERPVRDHEYAFEYLMRATKGANFQARILAVGTVSGAWEAAQQFCLPMSDSEQEALKLSLTNVKVYILFMANRSLTSKDIENLVRSLRAERDLRNDARRTAAPTGDPHALHVGGGNFGGTVGEIFVVNSSMVYSTPAEVFPYSNRCTACLAEGVLFSSSGNNRACSRDGRSGGGGGGGGIGRSGGGADGFGQSAVTDSSIGGSGGGADGFSQSAVSDSSIGGGSGLGDGGTAAAAAAASAVAALALGVQTAAEAAVSTSVTGVTAAASAAAESPVAALASGFQTAAAAAVATSVMGVTATATTVAASPVFALASDVQTAAGAAATALVTEVCDEDLEKAVGATIMPLPVLEEVDSQYARGDVSNSSISSSSSSSCCSEDSGGDGSGERGWMKPGVEPRCTLSTPVRHHRVALGDGGRYQGWRTPSIGAGTGVAASAAATPATAAAATATGVAASARAPAATPAAAGAATGVAASARAPTAPTAAAGGSGGFGESLVGGSGDNGGGGRGGSSDVTGSRDAP